MKKVIGFLLLAISMFSFFIFYKEHKETQIFNMKNAEHHLKNSYEIIIPTKINMLPRGKQHDKILKASKGTEASIYFTRIDQDSNKEKIIKYIYTIDDEYMKNFHISEGKKLDKTMMDTHYFLSTEKTGDPNQIGVIDTLGGDVAFEIRTLQSMLDDGMFLDGACTITVPDKESGKEFIKFITDDTDGDIQLIPSTDVGEPSKRSNLQISALFFTIMLLVLYDILRSYKNIAVEKMLGFSLFDIWKKRVSVIFFMQIGAIIFSTIIMSIFLVKKYNIYYINFLKALFINYIYLTCILIALVSIPFIYINNIKVSSMVKNKQAIKEIIFLNSLIKISLLVCLILLINTQVMNYKNIKNVFDKSYKHWDIAKEYAVLSLNRLTEEQVFSQEFTKKEMEAYKGFNKKGALFASFNSYRELDKSLNKEVPFWKMSAMVNPNYLCKHPVYDINGKRVSVSERNNNWVLLVPDKYKNVENKIRDYHKLRINSSGLEGKTKIEIIWVKSNQKYFSYNFSVNADKGGYVVDPIIFVGTEDGAFPGWNKQVFNVDGNPLKVKIEPGKTAKESIEPILKELGFDSYGIQINYANEEVVSEVKDYKDMFMWLVTGVTVTLIIINIVLIQNIYNFFQQFKSRLAIRQFHGYKKIHKYREYFILLLFSWFVVIAISFILRKAQAEVILSVSLAGIIFETIISLIVLSFIDRKKLTDVIKGGF